MSKGLVVLSSKASSPSHQLKAVLYGSQPQPLEPPGESTVDQYSLWVAHFQDTERETEGCVGAVEVASSPGTSLLHSTKRHLGVHKERRKCFISRGKSRFLCLLYLYCWSRDEACGSEETMWARWKTGKGNDPGLGWEGELSKPNDTRCEQLSVSANCCDGLCKPVSWTYCLCLLPGGTILDAEQCGGGGSRWPRLGHACV